MVSDLNMPHGKISEFISFPWFGFTLVIKLRNYISKVIACSALFFLYKKNDVRFEYVLSNSVLYGLSFVT